MAVGKIFLFHAIPGSDPRVNMVHQTFGESKFYPMNPYNERMITWKFVWRLLATYPEAAGSLYALALLDITDDTGAMEARSVGTIGCWIQSICGWKVR